MSQYSQIDDRVLWNPSNGVGGFFVATGESMARAVELPWGIRHEVADEHQVDPAVFVPFVDTLTRWYLGSSHAILRSLILRRGVLRLQ